MLKKIILLGLLILPGPGFTQAVDTVAVIRELDSMMNVAFSLMGSGKMSDAKPIIEAARELTKEKLGETHFKYAGCLQILGQCFHHMGQYKEAKLLYTESSNLARKILGKENIEYAKSLINLAQVLKRMDEFEEAEQRFLEAKEIIEKSLGKEDHFYSGLLVSLGGLYWKIGKFEKAEPILLEAAAIRERIYGKESTEYANCMLELGNLYDEIVNYEKAEFYYLQCKSILEKDPEKDPRALMAILANLAALYRKLGLIDKSISYNLEALAIMEKLHGKEHPDYAIILNNLSVIYTSKGNFEKADSMLMEAAAIWEKHVGKKGFYGVILLSHGIVYMHLGDTLKAEQLFLELVDIEGSRSKDRHGYARALLKLANLYHKKGNYDLAEPYYLNAKAIFEKGITKRDPFYGETLLGLLDIFEAQNRFDESHPLIDSLFQAIKSELSKSASFLSPAELAKYAATFRTNRNTFLNHLHTRAIKGKPTDPLPSWGYDHVLFEKGFLLSALYRLNSESNTTAETVELNNQLKEYRRRLAKEYSKAVSERKDVEKLEEITNTLEKDLARTLVGFSEAMHQVHWQEVQANLQPTEAAVEFVHYQQCNCYKIKSDSAYYGALVLLPGKEAPLFVPLFEKREIESLLKGANGKNFLKINALYSNQKLYELIWRPLETHLEGVNTVYCSLSGMLHRVNLEAIPVQQGSNATLSDNHQLVIVNSTRQIVTPAKLKNDGHDGYIVGGVRYDIDNDSMAATYAFEDYASRSITSPDEFLFEPDSTIRGGNWNYLPQTALEALDINHIFLSTGMRTQLDTGQLATEESLRSLGTGKPSPRILHIATHGFFFPDPKGSGSNNQDGFGSEPVFKISDDPMIRSGLILAGAQQAWTTGRTPESREDGILTAYEISQMNLSNTELVVLSACETGLGDIQSNEGVYGLQRAFKIAGAKYLIMSLWKVNDQSTRELMTEFYRQWLIEKLSIPEAFRKAQTNMKLKYPGAPYHWAGFVLVE